jgi:hypothetical protein
MRPALRSVAATLALGMVACSAPSHEYVRNTDVRAAFRIPSSWDVFSKDLVLGLPSGPQPSTPDPIKWLVGIDGDPEASPAHILDPSDWASDHPKGFALVEDLSFVDHDSASLNWLRNFLFPVDALAQNSSDGTILAYDDTMDEDAVHGIHLEFQFRASALANLQANPGGGSGGDGGKQTSTDAVQQALLGGAGSATLSPKFVELSQTAFLDEDANRLYLMIMLCSAECYDRNRSDIQSTVDSWTVMP